MWGVVKSFEEFSKNLPFLCLLDGYQLRVYLDVNLAYQVRFFLTYRALKVAGNYRPGRREMGFASRLGGAMSSGFSHKQLMLAEPSFTLRKHRICH